MIQLEERFWSKVNILEPDECWEWTRGTNRKGYGIFALRHNYNRGAHRIAYMLDKGEIPAHLEIRHKCDNPPCCNPNHLELGTRSDNMRDKVSRSRDSNGNEKKTQRPKGHAYTEDNTYVYTSRTQGVGRTSRRCRKCHAKRVLDAYYKAKPW